MAPDISHATKMMTRSGSNLRNMQEGQKVVFCCDVMLSQRPFRQNSSARLIEEQKVDKVHNSRKVSIENADNNVRYEFGRLISGGMIGMTYMARLWYSNGLFRNVCIKRMLGRPLAEKCLYPSIRREMEILLDVSELSGCVTLLDIVKDDESVGLVFPYYPHGDLYSFVKAANRRRELPERAVRAIFV